MFGLFRSIENYFYKVREFLWSYPDLLLFDKNSLANFISRSYSLARPFSHFVTATILMLALTIAAFNPAILLANSRSATFVEGVVMGVDESGLINEIDTVSPLVSSKFQLAADLLELIYEPLIKIDAQGNPIPKLASKVEVNKDAAGKELNGIDYIFTLRPDVFWHDGTRFTSMDVVATFNKSVELADADKGSNKSQILQELNIESINDFKLRIFVKQETGQPQRLIPNLLELIASSIRVMPAKYLTEVTPINFTSLEPLINKRPIGTGPFKFESANDDQITLTRFDSYYGDKAKIDKIDFKLFKTETAVVKALKNGEIHAYVSNSARQSRDLDNYPRIKKYDSNFIPTQYWGLYFNLVSGPEYVKDVKVRRALAKSINYDLLMKSILNGGEQAIGPIPQTSEFFNPDAGWAKYNPIEAKQDLITDGWAYNSDGKLVKNGQLLKINIKYADNFDREQVINSIQQDWEALGVTVEKESYPLEELKNAYLLSRSFDVILYGMNTFVDPDRYELFHSSAIAFPGLNISGYQSTDLTKKIVNKKVIDTPRSDRSLEIARSTLDKNVRKQEYKDFQKLIAEDQPVIFLYHPKFTYFCIKELNGVDLQNVQGIEERFDSITQWQLS